MNLPDDQLIEFDEVTITEPEPVKAEEKPLTEKEAREKLIESYEGDPETYKDLGLLEDDLDVQIEQPESHATNVSKELFNSDKIDLKTEVSYNEINDLTRLRFLEKKFGLDNVDNIIESFLSLRVSLRRKSRAEFIQALQTENKREEGGNWFTKMFSRGGGED